ncbi:MAG: hypothetical protein RR539_08115 [Clostridium sp.]|uniref:hypothetical protein n=1 Tax=Clostridium sp. TaxID=1506 RepID=UPI002FCBC5CF
MKKSISIILALVLMLSLMLTGCKKSSIDDFESAIKKNSEINYSKQETTIKAEIMGMEFNLTALGEVDKKSDSSIINVKYSTNVEENLKAEMEIYKDKKDIYIKDKASDKYVKSTEFQDAQEALTKRSIGGLLLETFKNDKEFKKTFKVSSDKEKKVTASISDEGFKKVFNGALESGEMFAIMEEAIYTQLITMAEQSNDIKATKDQIIKAAKEEAKVAVNEVKTQIKALKITNIQYTATIDGNGYLSSEGIKLSIIEPSTSVSVIVNLNVKHTDINSNKKVILPNIPKDKIVDINNQ